MGWFSRKRKEEKGRNSRLSPILPDLSQYPVTSRPCEAVHFNVEDFRSESYSNLQEFLEATVGAFHYWARQREAGDPPRGLCFMPLAGHRFPIWKPSYYQILQKAAPAYGLKVYKDGENWLIARCFDCDSCSRRIDCLSEEECP